MFWHLGTVTLRVQCQSAQMSKITNDGLTWSDRGCFIAVPILYGNLGRRPKVEIPLSAVTESRPKVTYHIRPKPYVPPKVKRDFRPKTETESQSYLSWHDYRSQQVPAQCPLPNYPVHLISFTFSPIMSAVQYVIKDTAARPHSTRCRCRQRSRFLGIVSTQWG